MFESVEAACRVLQRDPFGQEAIAIWQKAQADRTERIATQVAEAAPIVILEGTDGVGKTTLATNLQQSMEAVLVKTPPDELRHLRTYFDTADAELRRSYYLLGNYVCAAGLGRMEPVTPVIVDRFWPSSAAYALAFDLKSSTSDIPEVGRMPNDLVDLLPFGSRPIIFLVLDLPEEATESSHCCYPSFKASYELLTSCKLLDAACLG